MATLPTPTALELRSRLETLLPQEIYDVIADMVMGTDYISAAQQVNNDYVQPYQLQLNRQIRNAYAAVYYKSDFNFTSIMHLESFLHLLPVQHLQLLQNIRTPKLRFRCPIAWLHPTRDAGLVYIPCLSETHAVSSRGDAMAKMIQDKLVRRRWPEFWAAQEDCDYSGKGKLWGFIK